VLCHQVTNTGWFDLTLVDADLSQVMGDGAPVEIAATPDMDTVAVGETVAFTSSLTVSATSVVPCSDGSEGVRIERPVLNTATDHWVYETEDGQQVEGAASVEVTVMTEGFECVTPEGDPATFAG
jgi:hypothetical protein